MPPDRLPVITRRKDKGELPAIVTVSSRHDQPFFRTVSTMEKGAVFWAAANRDPLSHERKGMD